MRVTDRRTPSRWIGALLTLVFLPASDLAAQGPEISYPLPEAKHEVRVERSVMVPMPDGVRLATDLYFPEGAGDRLPTILVRTPYNKLAWFLKRADVAAHFFAGQGYVVAVQDTRGRFESEGDFTISAADRQDGTDMVDWIVRQPWSSGRVGTYGCSYVGENQIQLAAMRNPHHTAAIAGAAGGSARYFALLTGGALELSSAFSWFRNNGSKVFLQRPPELSREEWAGIAPFFSLAPRAPRLDPREAWSTLPLRSMQQRFNSPPSDWERFVSTPPGGAWWDSLGYITPADRFDVPTLHVNSWYEFTVRETLELFNQMRVNATGPRGRDHQYAIISPATHCESEFATEHTRVGELDLGDARKDFYGIYLRWFDHWLKGEANGVTAMPRVQIYVMGRNQWRAENEWPLARTRFTPYYLHSDGNANTRSGSGTLSTRRPGSEPPDRFVYDPADPVPSVGGPGCCNAAEDAPAGAIDQAAVEDRRDVLVYTTPALKRGVEVTGPLQVTLYVSSDARDTDFTAKLVDVHPSGKAYNIQEGILRARYREGVNRTVWMQPGEVVPVTFDLQATSNYFRPGHRIRLEISSSNFPRFDRNLNTGGDNVTETEWRTATNSVHHSARYPSHILLPVIP